MDLNKSVIISFTIGKILYFKIIWPNCDSNTQGLVILKALSNMADGFDGTLECW